MLNRLGGAMALAVLLLAPVAASAIVGWAAARYEPWLLFLLVPLSTLYILVHWDTYLDLSPVRNRFRSKEN